MITLTMSQAADLGLVKADQIDRHDFAPLCEHDPFGSLGVTEPLHTCEVCWQRDEDLATVEVVMFLPQVLAAPGGQRLFEHWVDGQLTSQELLDHTLLLVQG